MNHFYNFRICSFMAILASTALVSCAERHPAPTGTRPEVSSTQKEASVSLALTRQNYMRGEQLTLRPLLQAGEKPLQEGVFKVIVDDTLLLQVATPALSSGEKTTQELELDTHILTSGYHGLKLEWSGEGDNLSVSKNIRLTQGVPSNSLPVWLWARGLPKDTDFYSETGFTSAGGPLIPYNATLPLEQQLQRTKATAERSVAAGLQLSPVPQGGVWRRDFKALEERATPEWAYQGAWRHEERFYDPFNPEVQEAQNELNDAFVQALAPFPNWKFAFVDMEIQDHLGKPSFSPHARDYLNAKLGISESLMDKLVRGRRYSDKEVGAAQFIRPGVVPDDDPRLQLTRATVKGGNGVNGALHRVKKSLIEHGRGDVELITNPYRANMVQGMYPDADIIASWTYTNPDPKYTLFSETLRAGAGSQQKPMHIITLLNYPGMLAPTDQGWTLSSPDIAKLCSWIDLSRAPKVISFFFGSQVSPTRNEGEPMRVPPETTEALREMSERVYKPLGPLIRELTLSPRSAAILNSQVARIHNQSPRLIGYGGHEILPFQAVVEMAQIPADVVLDEDIEDGALDNYKLLFLPKVDAVTETMYQEIIAFTKRGGIVIADQYLGPRIPGAHQVDFDFTERSKVNADAITRGVTFADWDDQVMQAEKVEYVSTTGLTAEEDQRQMESYAKELRELVDDQITRQVEADSLDTLLSLAELNGAHYLFALNDRRVYSDRLRPFSSQLDQLVPRKQIIQLHSSELSDLVAYDLVEHRHLPRQPGSPNAIEANLDGLGGRLIALYPQAIQKLKVKGPTKLNAGQRGKLLIQLVDASSRAIQGGQPVQVTLTTPSGEMHEDGGYMVLEDGAGEFEFYATYGTNPGTWTANVLDLSSGLTKEIQFEVGPSSGK